MRPVLDRRLIYVTGKGGVGRSTVCAALGIAAAARGRRAIVCEVAGQDRLSRPFGREPRAGDEVAELADGLWGVSIDPQTALREFLSRLLASRTLSRLLVESQAFAYFAAAAPGTREIATLGKAAAFVEDREYDLAIVDAPASGHGLAMLRTPRTFGDIARVGPIHGHAERLRRILADRKRTAHVAVALAEEMPVNETLEVEAALPDIVGSGLAAIVVNQLYPVRFESEEVGRAEAALEADGAAPVVRRAVAAMRSEHRWASGQQAQLERLRAAAQAPVSTLPFLFAAELGRAELGELARRLEAGLAG
jgi:anion-transporting  ArsA/GET3 family ATPase